MATGEDAVEAVDRLLPDVVVMDLHLPVMSGITATRAGQRDVGVLVLTMLDDDATLSGALRAGANAYLRKGANHTEVEHPARGRERRRDDLWRRDRPAARGSGRRPPESASHLSDRTASADILLTFRPGTNRRGGLRISPETASGLRRYSL